MTSAAGLAWIVFIQFGESYAFSPFFNIRSLTLTLNMADAARRRLQAIGSQLAASGSELPAITQVAPGTNSPRAAGKVIIITGMSTHPGPLPNK